MLVEFNPVAIELGVVQIRWYGLMYLAGFGISAWLLKPLFRRWLAMSVSDMMDLIVVMMVGMILGGRIGYIAIYDLAYYAQDPLAMLRVWSGGLSFHGGLIGVGLGTALYAMRRGMSMWGVWDLVALGSTIGIGFGRIGNFINGELVGRVTSVPWAVQFSPDGAYRHPSQLYESVAEGWVLFAFLWWFAHSRYYRSGLVVSVFVGLYGVARFSMEWFRQPDPQVGTVLGSLSMGQVLSVVMMVLGVGMVWYRTQYLRGVDG